MSVRTLSLTVAFVSAFASPALAHHAFGMFDSVRSITMSGTVKSFEWTNPHSWIRLMVQDATGKQVEWSIEMGPPAQQAQRGWKPDSLRVRDRVSVTVHPLKNGRPGGQFMSVGLANERPAIKSDATDLVVASSPSLVPEPRHARLVWSQGGTNAPLMLMAALVFISGVGARFLRNRIVPFVVRA